MIHLHVHSKYSLRDSIIQPDELVKRLQEIGQNAVAITDHGSSLGGVSIYKTLSAAGIKYIHGVEFYTCDDVRIKDKDNKYYHLIALCKNETGRMNMNKLISMSEHPDNKYYKPRIDFDMLSTYGDGLVITSACMAGEVSRHLSRGERAEAIAVAKRYKERFGDDYYLEIQAHNDEEQIFLNKEILQIADELNIQTLVTTDAHYIYEEDRKYQNKYAFNGSYKEDGESYIDCFVQSEQEVRDRLSYLDQNTINKLIQTTHDIADKCNVEIPLSAPIMPTVETPDEFETNKEWLVSLCKDGFKTKLNIDVDNHCEYDKDRKMFQPVWDDEGFLTGYDEIHLTQDLIDTYIERYEYELNSLDRMGFIDYILLVYSYANIAKRRGIARGSGGGSLICYVTNITNIDPIEHRLYFERFIDVGALALLESGEITAKELKIPDIDLDFSGESCAEVLKFLYNKYGSDRVASIGKFGTNKTKGTIRDMCKVLDIDIKTADIIAKAFENYEIGEIDMMISGEIDTPNSAKEAVEYVKHYDELFDYVRKLNGLPKSFGLHACFTGETRVATSTGYKPIKDITTNDYVLTHKGRYKKVALKSEHESEDLVEISAIGVRAISCTVDHPFLVRERLHKKKRVFSEPKWVQAGDIKKTDLLAVAINNNCIIPKYANLATHTEKFWWIVGRYMGDGWCEYIKDRDESRVFICCEKNNFKELNDIVVHLFSNLSFRLEEARTTFKVKIHNREFFDFLQQFGKYAFGKHLTSTIYDLPNHLLEAFLEGYFSADGYVDKKGYQTFKTVSYDLALGISHCVAKVYHQQCSITTIPPKVEYIEGRRVHSREKYACCFTKTKRKKQRCEYDNGYVWSFVKNISHSNHEKKVYNLTVEDDATYVVENIVVHNCGKIIATRDLDYYLPSCYDKDGIRFLQGDMHDVEDVGLVKIDVLGLRTLDQEYDTLEMSGEDAEFINPKQRYDDDKVLDIFRNGDTLGIFQFASHGMRQTLKKMNVSGIEDLSVANALYRPGSLAYIDDYCNRKKGLQPFEYLHPDLEGILQNTYGIIVFQEQLIEIGRLAGIHNPDLLRKATGKKNPKLLAQVKPELEEKLKARGWSDEQFDKLWADMLEFAKYSFNKAHSSAYGILAYITAKQKAYYPAEFFAGLCNSHIGHSEFVKDDASDIMADARKHGVLVKPLDFRDDHRQCHVQDNRIVYAIPLIRDCNLRTAEILYEHRNTTRRYFWQLAKDLLDAGMDASKLDILIQLGFFNEYGNTKKILRLFDIFKFFKGGERKSIKKSLLPEGDALCNIVQKYSVSTNKDGSESKTFKDLQIDNILCECEDNIMSLDISDMDFREKILAQRKYLGFVSLMTDKEEDRPKLYVKDVFPLKRKKDGVHFGYSIIAQSIGSGKETRYTVFNRIYKQDPIEQDDIIRCLGYEREGQYFTLTGYKHILF